MTKNQLEEIKLTLKNMKDNDFGDSELLFLITTDLVETLEKLLKE